jgi:hypothetical protein
MVFSIESVLNKINRCTSSVSPTACSMTVFNLARCFEPSLIHPRITSLGLVGNCASDFNSPQDAEIGSRTIRRGNANACSNKTCVSLVWIHSTP